MTSMLSKVDWSTFFCNDTETTEIYTPGGIAVMNEILQRLLRNGARMA